MNFSTFIILSLLTVPAVIGSLNITPVEEYCQWLFSGCPEINQKTFPPVIPTMDPSVPLTLTVTFVASRLLFIDELTAK